MESHVRLYLLRYVHTYIYMYRQCHKPTIVMLLVELMKNSKVLKQTNLHFRCECATKPAAMIFFLLLFFFFCFCFQFSFMALYFLLASLSDFFLVLLSNVGAGMDVKMCV